MRDNSWADIVGKAGIPVDKIVLGRKNTMEYSDMPPQEQSLQKLLAELTGMSQANRFSITELNDEFLGHPVAYTEPKDETPKPLSVRDMMVETLRKIIEDQHIISQQINLTRMGLK